MEVFVDVVTVDGEYRPFTASTWIDAGVGRVVPNACKFALAHHQDLPSAGLAVYHVEERRFVQWRSFRETSVRDFDTLVVRASSRSRLVSGDDIDSLWLAAGGLERRVRLEAQVSIDRDRDRRTQRFG